MLRAAVAKEGRRKGPTGKTPPQRARRRGGAVTPALRLAVGMRGCDRGRAVLSRPLRAAASPRRSHPGAAAAAAAATSFSSTSRENARATRERPLPTHARTPAHPEGALPPQLTREHRHAAPLHAPPLHAPPLPSHWLRSYASGSCRAAIGQANPRSPPNKPHAPRPPLMPHGRGMNGGALRAGGSRPPPPQKKPHTDLLCFKANLVYSS